MLKAVNAPRTAGATKDNHLFNASGNSKRDNMATGNIRGKRLTRETPIIIK